MQSHRSSNSSTLSLLSSKPFEHHFEDGPRIEELERSYHRARAIGQLHGVTLEDCLHMTPKFWAVHKDGIIVRDAVAHILVTIQLNLVAGTVAPFALKRPDLHPLMKEILNFDISAPFMLNEVGHGCDSRNLETTATLQHDGSFILNTPTPEAVKFMPPSMPIKGIRRVAIVCARLMVDEEDRGIRTFVVPINNGTEMNKGVHSWLLPPISGGRVLDHSLTSFDNVHLPANAMLGELAMPADMRAQYLSAIHRLGTGALALSLWIIPFLKCAAYCVGKYSQRRTVQAGVHGERVPIISFRTQQLPILHSLAQIAVMEPFSDWITHLYSTDNSLHPGAKHGLGVIIKAVFLQNGQWSLANLIERSGAQGVYPHNQMATFEVLTRATGIAEGEVLVLSIRLATELLLGRYAIPGPTKPNCILAQHEKNIVSDLKKKLRKIGNHRGDEYSKQVLPHLRPLIIAIGQRMAYEAAVDASVDPDLLALYEAGAMKSDPAWFSEHLGISRDAQFQKECAAADAAYRRLNEHLDNWQIEPYITAPMLSADRWMGMIKAVPEFTGNGEMSFPGAQEFRSKL
ncbi:acyl-CoA oxidase [Aspergillus eucalypticola CBS 122712]|uniref:Acyl-CoA oxidase n=1 Tax=Aspergillus eucalypticola (strain CBS 122712 / IBT 29274) TaxID=1448314 RepID=A0A317VB27_ASPEC|nr:acyl-CoA oxidase [Aspergillus eucalypticola CBS 122712]PWY71235.1 acyl-CoA oxidase [Aspergillus eucalypticola CBS 122712]